jgi:rhodanese-related sulfurtransferase
MAKTFKQMSSEAMAEVKSVSPTEARERLQKDRNAVLVDVRDEARIRQTGKAAGAIPISAGNIPIRADKEVPVEFRDERLQDRSRPVITICDLGPQSAIAAKTLKDMGFTNVNYVEGGTQGWIKAGLPTEKLRAD